MHRHSLCAVAWLGLGLGLGLGLATGCATDTGTAEPPLRLVDVFADEMVAGRSATPLTPPPRTEWRFEDVTETGTETATAGFEAFANVSGLAVREGLLSGRSTSELPLLHVESPESLDEADQLHSIEVRLRASAGANFAIAPSADPLPVPEAAPFFMNVFGITTPIVAGEDAQSYTLRSSLPVPARRLRHLYIRPTDTAGADFAIESIRIVLRKEYLAGIESGVGFQGMSEVYRESLVSRAPETMSLPVEVPRGGRLELALGTVDPMPVTFRVALGDDVLLEQTVTTPYRWEHRILDLSAHAGRSEGLTLSLASEEDGAVGIWGTPILRPPSQAAPGRPRNVIVLWTDTLRRDHLSAYGYDRKTSPNLDRLASEGALFLNNVSQATWTKVSTPSMMTSLYPSTHGVKDFSDHLPVSATTLAEVYRDAGYRTVSFASNLFTGQFTNLHQGFEEVHEDGSLPEVGSSKTSRELVDRFTRWLDAHQNTPFFAFLHLYDPHDPFEPRPPYASLWADPEKKHAHEEELEKVRKVIKEPLAINFGMPSRVELEEAGLDADAYVDYDKDWYDGSIRGLDTEVGRLLERLRVLGMEESTLVVFAVDHGEEFLDHGRTFHGQSVYGELTNVPLIMRWPGGIAAGRRIDATTETVDIMPTLLALSGLEAPEAVQGHSLVPLLREGEGAWQPRPAFSEKAVTKPQAGSPWPSETEAYAIVEGEWKLIRNVVPEEGKPEFELFRFAEDPLDQTNLADDNPEVVKRLAEILDGWRTMASAAKLPPDSESTEGMSQEQLERLRSLGYIR